MFEFTAESVSHSLGQAILTPVLVLGGVGFFLVWRVFQA